jgi:hypothetical protein
MQTLQFETCVHWREYDINGRDFEHCKAARENHVVCCGDKKCCHHPELFKSDGIGVENTPNLPGFKGQISTI